MESAGIGLYCHDLPTLFSSPTIGGRMNPTPEQVRQALDNHHRPYRTHGAKVRDALAHAKQSRNNKPGEAGLCSPVEGHHASREGLGPRASAA